MRQVAGVLAVVFVGVTVFSYAGVSIPYTFTAGTTAKASEVNANFQALANGMPAVKSLLHKYFGSFLKKLKPV